MKRIVKLLNLLVLFLMPVLVSAHPGHGHDGGIGQVFLHYVTTYYIFLLPVVAILGYVIYKAYRKKSQA